MITAPTLPYSAHITMASTASDTDEGEAVMREMSIRRLIDGSIKENEKQAILTGVRIYDVSRDRFIADHNRDQKHFAASINKLPVTLFILEDIRKGTLRLDQEMTWQASDVRAGYGDFDQPGAPLKAPLSDVLRDMLQKSGNTAVRILVNNGLGGAAKVNERIAATGKLPNTYLQPLDASRFYLGYTTPQDSMRIITQIMNKDGAAAKVAKDSMKDNIFTDFGVRSQLVGSEYLTLMNKVGILDDVEGNNRHDVGVIYNTKKHKTYIYSLMTTSPYEKPAATTRAEDSLKEIGHDLLQHAGKSKGASGYDSDNKDKAEAFRSQQSAPEKKVLY